MATSTHRTRLTTPSPTSVVVTRSFAAPRALVWAAHTEPEHVRHWMVGPEGWSMPVCEIDLRPGGAWHFVWRRDDGSELDMTGSYLEVVPPSRLVTSESWGPEWPATVNTVELLEVDGGTELTNTIEYDSEASRDRALGTGMTSGMEQSYARLDLRLASVLRE